MDPFHFSCPHCSSRLRVREKLLVGRQVDCPECGDTLLIVDRGGELGVERVERKAAVPSAGSDDKKNKQKDRANSGPSGAVPSTARSKSQATQNNAPVAPAASAPEAVPQQPSGLRDFLFGSRRRLLALGAAVTLVALTVALIFAPRTPHESEEIDESSAGLAGDGTVAPGPMEGQDEQPAGLPAGLRDDLDARLSKIGDLLLELVASEKAFPAGTFPAPRLPPENRLSWMAMLADRLDDDSAPAPVWNRAWNDPQNEPFVRRRLTMFQNPAIDQLTGVDGYPAGHFVGVAGVGADAATLADRDPREESSDTIGGRSWTTFMMAHRTRCWCWGFASIWAPGPPAAHPRSAASPVSRM